MGCSHHVSLMCNVPLLSNAGDLLARLRSTETQMAHQEQQLAAVVGQQEALKEVITRLVESLEDQKLARNSAAVAEVQELQQQVTLRQQHPAARLHLQGLRLQMPGSTLTVWHHHQEQPSAPILWLTVDCAVLCLPASRLMLVFLSDCRSKHCRWRWVNSER